MGVRKGVKIAALMEMQAEETNPVDEAGPGAIVAVAKVEELHTGSCLGELSSAHPVPHAHGRPGRKPKSRGDESKLSGALQKICEEDSTFRRDLDAQTKEMVVTGMSELHLQILRERLKRRDKVEIETREPKIPYRETIQANAEGMYRHKKQTGGQASSAKCTSACFRFPRTLSPKISPQSRDFPR